MIIPLNWLKDYIDIEKSPKEIAESFTKIGLMLDRPIENNILDLEQRLNRADLLSITGCARDLAAFEGLNFTEPKTTIKKGKELVSKDKVEIKIESKNSVNRFYTRVFKNIKVEKSPKWLIERLENYGIPSINNIVDITNFVMVELGQPMHAQDLAKFDKREIVIRKANKGEKIVTLLGESVNLNGSVDVLSQNDEAIAIMGIVGGKRTGVTEKTKDIILDAGNYNQETVRKTSRRLKIINETVSRYDKYLDPRLAQVAIERATYLIQKIAGGEYYENSDYYPDPVSPKHLSLRTSRINKLSGMTFNNESTKNTLTKLGYEIVEEKDNTFTLEIPYHRTDVEVEDDLVSDVLRMNDYNNIPAKSLSVAPPKNITPELITLKRNLRIKLLNIGADEHITDPIVSSTKSKSQVRLVNSLSKEKSALRESIYKTLLPVTNNYPKHQINDTLIFEIGRTYHQENSDDLRYSDLDESHELCVIYKNTNLSIKDSSTVLRSKLYTLTKSLNLPAPEVKHESDIYIITIKEVRVGELTYDHFTLDLNKILPFIEFESDVITEFENTKTVDLSIVLDDIAHIGDVQHEILKTSSQILNQEVIEDTILDKLGRVALIRITTTENTDTKNLIKKISKLLKEKFDIQLRT